MFEWTPKYTTHKANTHPKKKKKKTDRRVKWIIKPKQTIIIKNTKIICINNQFEWMKNQLDET